MDKTKRTFLKGMGIAGALATLPNITSARMIKQLKQLREEEHSYLKKAASHKEEVQPRTTKTADAITVANNSAGIVVGDILTINGEIVSVLEISIAGNGYAKINIKRFTDTTHKNKKVKVRNAWQGKNYNGKKHNQF